LIQNERGVVGSLLGERAWPGVTVETYALRWMTEPGSIRLLFQQPALCLVSREAGGLSQFRRDPNEPVAGVFYGLGALAFVAASDPVVVYAPEMREARLTCFLFDAAGAAYLEPQDAADMAAAGTRYMFKDDRLRTFAEVLASADGEAEGGRFTTSLSQALFAAALEWVRAIGQDSALELSGPAFERAASFIRDNLDQTIKIEDLARAAGLQSERFGQAFRDATGLSPRRWQMDARVRAAQRLMVDTPDANLAGVASLSGFADQSHFSRAFLEVVGLTPTAWLHKRQ
jgi:AraC family transcriptional regulator